MSSENIELVGGDPEENASKPPVPPPAPPLAKPATRKPPRGKMDPAPQKPLWPTPENAGGRTWLVIMLFIAVIGLYAWGISQFYAGAQGGVDQAGYLMTARLITGDRTIDTPYAPAPATMPASQPPPAGQVPAAVLPAGEHTHPYGLQTWSSFDWLRNRLSFVPASPFQFASRMCIITEPFGPAAPSQPAQYRVYAKYPFGYPLLAAIGRLFFGIDGMYIINPLCTILACYFAYFLFRQAVSPFMSLLGVIWLACNPMVLVYANDANSHSSTLLFIVAGFWGLLSWLRTRQNWRAWIGGLALGYACTIRYTEFLMVLPVLFAALVNFRFQRKRIWGSVSLVLAWAIPVAVLAAVCWISFGAPWKTGYTYCRESTGFAWKYLTGDDPGGGVIHKAGNWETLVSQLNILGLFILWPLALAGLFAMMGSAWRLGVTVGLWVLPQTLLYMLYYWAPQGDTTTGYLRFFMTVLPGFILAALWILERGLIHLRGEKRAALIGVTAFGLLALVAAALYVDPAPLQSGLGFFPQVVAAVWRLFTTSWIGCLAAILFLALIAGIWVVDHEHAEAKVALALGAGVITALGCAININNILPRVESEYTQSMDLRTTVDNMRKFVPRGSVVFGEDRLLQEMDCIGDWKLIDSTLFSQATFQKAKRRLETLDKDADQQDDPNPVQPERSRFTLELLGEQNLSGYWIAKPASELLKYENAEIDHAFTQGRRVMFLVQDREISPGRFSRAAIPQRRDCDVKLVAHWEDEPPVDLPVPRQRRFNGGRNRPQRAQLFGPPRGGGAFVMLYELVKKPPKVVPPKLVKPAKVEPAPKKPSTSTPPKHGSIFDF